MSVDTNFFVTFPVEGTQTVIAGILRLDFILGKAVLPDETIIPLANRITQQKPLQSVFFNIDNDINVEMSLNNKITYTGLIPAGRSTIKDVKYDQIIITTSTSTEIAITGSHKTDCIVSDISSTATTPTLYTITMTLLDTQYSQALPSNTKKIEFRCRSANDIRYAFLTGKVAGPIDPYKSLTSGEVKSESNLNLTGIILYVACSVAGQIVELEVWT